MASQFQQAGYTIVGIQETRLRRPRAFPIGPYSVVAAAAGDTGQAGIELWIRADFICGQSKPLVVHATKRVLMVKVYTRCGLVQVVVAHALDSSYPLAERKEWWGVPGDIMLALFSRSAQSFWLVDANVSLGSVMSTTVGPRQPEKECEVGACFHKLLIQLEMTLPATCIEDEVAAGKSGSPSEPGKTFLTYLRLEV